MEGSTTIIESRTLGLAAGSDEALGWADGSDTALLELAHDFATDVPHFVTTLMKLGVGDRASGRTDRLPPHADAVADQGLRVGKRIKNVSSLSIEFLALERHEGDVVSAGAR